MYVRLAFAVAAHLEPEILVVDEVLAVGDAAFQNKCLGKMQEVARGGRTILLVSHQMDVVRRLCTRAVLLNQGKVTAEGDVSDVVNQYLAEGAGPRVAGRAGGNDAYLAPGRKPRGDLHARDLHQR